MLDPLNVVICPGCQQNLQHPSDDCALCQSRVERNELSDPSMFPILDLTPDGSGIQASSMPLRTRLP